MQLIDYDLLTEPLLNLSPYFEVRSDKYRHLLREVSIRGAWDEWISFFCEALSAQASDAESRIRSLLAWRRNTMEMLRANRVKGVALTVTEKLIEFPTLTVKHISKAHGVSPQAANNAAHRLMQLGVLEEVTGRSYNRVFQATEVFSILFRSPDRPEPGL